MSEPAAEPKPDDVVESRSQRNRRRRRRLYIGLGIAGVVIVVLAGIFGGFYLSFAAKVREANARMQPDIEQALATPPSATLVSEPQASTDTTATGGTVKLPEPAVNLLVLGTDARPGEVESPGASDVLMLFHIDRARNFVSILSIPRDLYVHIPGYGMDRINAAYYIGGPAMTIATIKDVLGVDVTKYIGVGFSKFPGIIDSLGGVYIDVDRRYTNATHWPIDLQAGYQLLDGEDALLFARYRFDKNSDVGRMARQQRILAAVRQQAVDWNLTLKLPGIVDQLMDSTTTNLSAGELVSLASWLIRVDGGNVKQMIIRGPGKIINGKAVVVADQATLVDAVTELLTPPGGERGPAAEEPTPVADAAGQAGNGQLVAAIGAATSGYAFATATTTTSAATQPAVLPDAAMWQAAQATVPFILEAPRSIPEGFKYVYKAPEGDGTYGIKVGDETRPAVRMVYRYKNSDLCLGVTATTWLDAPVAAEGSTVESGGTIFTVVGTRGHVDQIWWKRNGVLYFISNTLLASVDRDDLLEMAKSMAPVSAAR